MRGGVWVDNNRGQIHIKYHPFSLYSIAFYLYLTPVIIETVSLHIVMGGAIDDGSIGNRLCKNYCACGDQE